MSELRWQDRNRCIQHICDQVRDGQFTHDEWHFLMQHAPPILKRLAIKYVCYRAAGLDSQAYRLWYGRDPVPEKGET